MYQNENFDRTVELSQQLLVHDRNSQGKKAPGLPSSSLHSSVRAWHSILNTWWINYYDSKFK